jgi:hypothetical protein
MERELRASAFVKDRFAAAQRRPEGPSLTKVAAGASWPSRHQEQVCRNAA